MTLHLFARVEEVAPVGGLASDGVFRVRFLDLFNEILELFLWHGDVRIAWLYDCVSVHGDVTEQVGVETSCVNVHTPGLLRRRLEPVNLFAFTDQILVVAAEAHLGWVLGRVIHVGVDAEDPLLDHVLVVHLV